MSKSRLLVIDDEFGPRESLRFLFKDKYETICVDSVDHDIQELRSNPPDYVKKPFDASKMRAVVKAHVDKTRMQRGSQAAYDNLRTLNEQLQAELSSKEHLAMLGQASSEFVHYIRNPLTAICGYVSLLMDTIKTRPGFSLLRGFISNRSTRSTSCHGWRAIARNC
jgi:signal transduction histidine kinase